MFIGINPSDFTPDGNGTHRLNSPMRQGGTTADARKTSTDYDEWTVEPVSRNGQRGDTIARSP